MFRNHEKRFPLAKHRIEPFSEATVFINKIEFSLLTLFNVIFIYLYVLLRRRKKNSCICLIIYFVMSLYLFNLSYKKQVGHNGHYFTKMFFFTLFSHLLRRQRDVVVLAFILQMSWRHDLSLQFQKKWQTVIQMFVVVLWRLNLIKQRCLIIHPTTSL